MYLRFKTVMMERVFVVDMVFSRSVDGKRKKR